MLKESEYLSLAPSTPGTVRVNHSSLSCKGSSKSMRITRHEDESVTAKCYRCGEWGKTGGRLTAVVSYAKKMFRERKIEEVVYLPKDFTSEYEKFPAIVKYHLNKYQVTELDVKGWNIGWSEYLERFIIPVYRNLELVGYTGRYYGTDLLPKYVTRCKRGETMWQYHHVSSSSPCVFVEDMLSGIRCSKFCNVCVLFGTELDAKCLDYVSNMKASSYIVFLDDDNPEVKKKAIKIKDSLTMLSDDVKIHRSGGRDPKEHSPEELKEILCGT